ncbi:MAG TPA: stalk domain-containing protein [Syntrophomonas sp.]|nr:stalk domain-containing protein [Syntrophomonas sp.]
MLKKNLPLLLGLCLLLGFIAFVPSPAQAVAVFVNHKQVRFDAAPFIEGNRTLVPIRGILEAMGAQVDWDSEQQMVSVQQGDLTIDLKIGSKEVTVNKDTYELDVPAVIVQDRTFIPLRFIAEHMQYDVSWNGDTQTVYITSASGTAGNNIFAGNTADSPVTTKVASLSQYRYGVAKICVDGRWFYIDKQGNEVTSLSALNCVKGLHIQDQQPLLAYKDIEQVDDVLLLQTDDAIQCIDLNSGANIFKDSGNYSFYIEDRYTDGQSADMETGSGIHETILGNGQRAITLSKINVESTTIINVDTKAVLMVDCFQDWIQEGLYMFRENGMYGFKNLYNEVVIPATHPQSLRNSLFTEGLALLQKSGADDKVFVCYDRQGQVRFEIQLGYQDELAQFHEGLAKIGRSYLYGYIDTTGQVVIEPQYATAADFTNEVAIVSKNQKYGVINADGSVAIPLEYDSLSSDVPFPEGPARCVLNPNYPVLARQNDKWGYVAFPQIIRVWPAGQEHYSYEMQPSRTVVPFIYSEPPLKQVLEFTADQCYDNPVDSQEFCDPYAVFKVDDRLVAVGLTLEGEVLTPGGYDEIGDPLQHEFMNGRMHVVRDGKLGFVNTEFTLVIPLNYTGLAYCADYGTQIPYFADDVACVVRGEKVILIDRSGKELLYFN